MDVEKTMGKRHLSEPIEEGEAVKRTKLAAPALEAAPAVLPQILGGMPQVQLSS